MVLLLCEKSQCTCSNVNGIFTCILQLQSFANCAGIEKAPFTIACTPAHHKSPVKVGYTYKIPEKEHYTSFQPPAGFQALYLSTTVIKSGRLGMS